MAGGEFDQPDGCRLFASTPVSFAARVAWQLDEVPWGESVATLPWELVGISSVPRFVFCLASLVAQWCGKPNRPTIWGLFIQPVYSHFLDGLLLGLLHSLYWLPLHVLWGEADASLPHGQCANPAQYKWGPGLERFQFFWPLEGRGLCLKIDGKTVENLQHPMMIVGLDNFNHWQVLGITNFYAHTHNDAMLKRGNTLVGPWGYSYSQTVQRSPMPKRLHRFSRIW